MMLFLDMWTSYKPGHLAGADVACSRNAQPSIERTF